MVSMCAMFLHLCCTIARDSLLEMTLALRSKDLNDVHFFCGEVADEDLPWWGESHQYW